MLLAHLRGLLSPRYEHGLQSVIKENMILAALSVEADVDMLLHKLHVDCAFAGQVTAAGAKSLMEGAYYQLDTLRHYTELETDYVGGTRGSVEDIVALYEALASAGIVGPNADEEPYVPERKKN